MPREVTDGDGVTWCCIQAFAGLDNNPAEAEAARVKDADDGFQVVCTPSGGVRSVRIELRGGWEEESPDEEILAATRAQLA